MLSKNRILLLIVFISLICLTTVSNQSTLTAQEVIGPEKFSLFAPVLLKPFAPLYEGFYARWDGTGYVHWDKNYIVGSHRTRMLFSVEGDIGEIYTYHWYDPDPFELGESSFFSFYSLSTGRFLSSSGTHNPYWKWGSNWILPFDIEFQNGQNVYISDQKFSVTGIHHGVTTFGKPVDYWELINQDKFLIWDDGGDWNQYVEQGDAKLRYDAGRTRLKVHSDIKRTYYQNGKKSEFSVHYITNLTSSTTWPGYEGFGSLEPLVKLKAPLEQAPSILGIEDISPYR